MLDTDLSEFRQNRYLAFTGAVDSAIKNTESALMFGLLMGVVMIITVSVTALLITGMLMRNLSNVITSMREIAAGDGDLTINEKADYPDSSNRKDFVTNRKLFHGIRPLHTI